MKKLRNLIAVMAVMSMAGVLTGCNDDDSGDDDDDDNGGNQGPDIVAPVDEAALRGNVNVYTVTVGGGAIELRFPAAGQYTITRPGGIALETGAYDAATRADNRWTMNLTPAAGGPAEARAGVLQLDFNANNAGSWTFTPAGGPFPETGSFTVANVPPGGGPPVGGFPPANLVGKTLQLSFGQFGEKFVFITDTTARYEDTEDATYTWDQNAARVNATRAGGQTYEITLAANGVAVVVYRDNPNAQQTTENATYTLTP